MGGPGRFPTLSTPEIEHTLRNENQDEPSPFRPRGRRASRGLPDHAEQPRVPRPHGRFDRLVAAGAARPRPSGRGPLRANQWIVADIFPRDLRTGYWGDMTRTFMRGRPSPALRRLYDTVLDAQALGLSLVKPGAIGAEVHRAVADFFKKCGYETGTDASGRAFGFFHGLGHGVGLGIHEEPRLSLRGGALEPGMVVTVEPGLYYPDLGGVRIEDTVVVTETGCRVL